MPAAAAQRHGVRAVAAAGAPPLSQPARCRRRAGGAPAPLPPPVCRVAIAAERRCGGGELGRVLTDGRSLSPPVLCLPLPCFAWPSLLLFGSLDASAVAQVARVLRRVDGRGWDQPTAHRARRLPPPPLRLLTWAGPRRCWAPRTRAWLRPSGRHQLRTQIRVGIRLSPSPERRAMGAWGLVGDAAERGAPRSTAACSRGA
eukprot:355922-Chlamydomonas_euryale.AAC.9